MGFSSEGNSPFSLSTFNSFEDETQIDSIRAWVSDINITFNSFEDETKELR